MERTNTELNFPLAKVELEDLQRRNARWVLFNKFFYFLECDLIAKILTSPECAETPSFYQE